MKCSKLFLSIALLIGIFAFTGCNLIDDASDEIEELIYGPEKEIQGPKRPYRYIRAMATEQYGAILDPYDGTLDLINPVSKSRFSKFLSLDPTDAVLLEDLSKMAVLDSVRDEVRIVEIESKEVVHLLEVGETVNRLVESPYGTWLLAVYDPDYGEVEFGDSGMINYFEIDILNAKTGTRQSLSIDFSPDKIVFNPINSTCLLGKGNRLISLNLESSETVSFPLTLSQDDPKNPYAITISPDGEYALSLIENSPDVYVFDLVNLTINILDLTGQAKDILFIPQTRTALLTVPSEGTIAVVDLDEAIPEVIEVGHALDQIILSPDQTKAAFVGNEEAILVTMNLDDLDTRIYALNVILNTKMDAPVAFSPDSSKILVVGEPYTGTYGSHDIDLIDLATHNVVPIGFEEEIKSYAFSTNYTTIGFLLPRPRKLVTLNYETLEAQSRLVGKLAKNVSYVPGASAFMVDTSYKRGKLIFVGDQGSDIFWIAARYLDHNRGYK